MKKYEAIAVELYGISSTVQCMATIVEPKKFAKTDTPTKNVIDSAFFGIASQLERIADAIAELEGSDEE